MRDLRVVCEGKVKFKTRAYAEQAIKLSRHVHHAQQPYKCEFCEHWHNGARPPKSSKFREAERPDTRKYRGVFYSEDEGLDC